MCHKMNISFFENKFETGDIKESDADSNTDKFETCQQLKLLRFSFVKKPN